MYKNIIMVVMFLAGVYLVANKPNQINYVNEQKTQADIITLKTLEIYNSQEFQSEMLALATARALFDLSLSRQDNAVELSEMAMISYTRSQEMANLWHNK